MIRRLAMAAAFMFVAVLVTANAQDKAQDKSQDKAVGALPPHGLDKAFARGNTANDITNGLLNNDLFKLAVQAAAKAKQERLAALRQNPGMVGPTPDQAARQAFLNTLNAQPEQIGAPKSK